MFRFKCPECATSIKASAEKAGKAAICPGCKRPIIVPAMRTDDHTEPLPALPRGSESGSLEPPGQLSIFEPAGQPSGDPSNMIRFACPTCRQVIVARVSEAGEKVRCSRCNQKLQVPNPQVDQTILGELLPGLPLQQSPQPAPPQQPHQVQDVLPVTPQTSLVSLCLVGTVGGVFVVTLLLLVVFLPWFTVMLGVGIVPAAVYALVSGQSDALLRRIIPANAPRFLTPSRYCSAALAGGIVLLMLSAVSVVRLRQTDAANHQVTGLTETARQHIASGRWDEAEKVLNDALTIEKATNHSEASALLGEVQDALEQHRIARGKQEAATISQTAKEAFDKKEKNQAHAADRTPSKEAEPPAGEKAAGVAEKPPRKVPADPVLKAIEDGKKYLLSQQLELDESTGHWEIDINAKARRGGWTSLAMLALLNAGEEPKVGSAVWKGLRYLREVAPADTYVVGLQTAVFAKAGLIQDEARIQRNVDWLVQTRVMKGNELLGWGYRANGQSADNSNTSYALLGLWAGHTAGAKIDPAVWESIREFYRSNQDSNGGWYYIPQYRTPTLTMTTAGVCGLLIAGQALNADQQELDKKTGIAAKCGQYPEDKALASGMKWVVDHFQVEVRHHLFYNLYGIARAGRLSGQQFIGDHDWYREGCQYLVRNQQDDGSWYLRGQGFDSWPVISTSYALLFLSQGRTPISISKLVHGSPDKPTLDWNRKHNDLRNLTDQASKQLFKERPLGWQIFNVRDVQPGNDEQIRKLVGELQPSPIVWISGHNKPIFTAWEKKMLRQYVDQGGFILAEACCGSKEFDAGFRELITELFGKDAKLESLKADHAIWRAHLPAVDPREVRLEGVDLGGKTVVVYSSEPISSWWEANQFNDGRGKLAFHIGMNIIAYATGLEMPKPRKLQGAEMTPAPR